MASNFLENLRNTPGIVYNPLNNQRLNFTKQTPYYDNRSASIRNLDNAERNFGVSERSNNALIDRSAIEDKSERGVNIPPLRVENNYDGPEGFSEILPGLSKNGSMKIWRLDGKPFNFNSYLNSVERVIDDVSSSEDTDSLLKALKRGYNEWGMNNHVLWNNVTRSNDLYDSTPATLIRYLYDDIKANKNGEDFETLRSKSIDNLRDQFIPKWITERVESI